MKKSNKSSLTQKAMQALTIAVAQVIEDHRRQNRPLAVWRDGKAVWISASDAGVMANHASLPDQEVIRFNI